MMERMTARYEDGSAYLQMKPGESRKVYTIMEAIERLAIFEDYFDSLVESCEKHNGRH